MIWLLVLGCVLIGWLAGFVMGGLVVLFSVPCELICPCRKTRKDGRE